MTFTPFLERDVRYLATMVALALGYSTDEYQATERVKVGFSRLRAYLHEYPPENVHDRMVLLWASIRTAGLLDVEEQQAIERTMISMQRPDGGWALPSLGTWPRIDGDPNDPDSPSDGYATGLATFVQCERGHAESEVVRRAVDWMRTNQRESGRWYTRSLYSERFRNYLSTMGTAYVAMALNACRRSSP